jgi:hypothetical protein
VDAVAKPLAEVGGAGTFVHAAIGIIRRRLGRGRAAIDENVHRWSQRGAWPYTFTKFLKTREAWPPGHLARLLFCSESDAEALLELYGYGRREDDGLWHLEADDAARVLAAIAEEAMWAEVELGQEKDREFVERVTYVLSRGERPPEAKPLDESEFPSLEQIERRERLRRRLAASGIAAAGVILGVVLGRGSVPPVSPGAAISRKRRGFLDPSASTGDPTVVTRTAVVLRPRQPVKAYVMKARRSGHRHAALREWRAPGRRKPYSTPTAHRVTQLLLHEIKDFGGIDADADELLRECFQNHPAYTAAKGHARFLVLGRKGSGKTAIFKRLITERQPDVFSFGHTFDDYPWPYHDLQAQAGVPEDADTSTAGDI